MSSNGRPTAGDSLRVALLSPCFWPEVRRGAERVVRDLADGLIATGHRPRLITSHPGRPSRTVENGLPITRHWRPPGARLDRRRYEAYLTHAPFSYLSLRLGNDDIAQAVHSPDAVAAARWTRRTGKPSVFSYMGIPDHRGLMMRRQRLGLTLRAIDGCSAVTALSDGVAREFERWLGVEARVIYPGVDLGRFHTGWELAESPTIFSAAAIEEPAKRIPLLVDAFRLLRRRTPSLRLVLSRPLDPGLAERFERENPDVELADMGRQGEGLPRAYGEAWAVALPSLGEAFGLVLVEALASGTPVVASNVGGMAEIVDSDAIGRVFDGHEPEALARALEEALELAEDPGTLAACRSRADDFSIGRSVERHLELYRELLGRPAATVARPDATSAGLTS